MCGNKKATSAHCGEPKASAKALAAALASRLLNNAVELPKFIHIEFGGNEFLFRDKQVTGLHPNNHILRGFNGVALAYGKLILDVYLSDTS